MDSQVGRNNEGQTSHLDIAHLWQEGDGEQMLKSVLEQFQSRHPNIDVSEQGYANHGMAIKSRILREDAPATFVEFPGDNLDPYLEAGAIRNLSDLWDEHGLHEVYNEGITELATYDGKQYALPVDIHRMNNLFYNVELVEQIGIDPHRIDGPREFLDVLRQCEDEGVVGLQQPMKNPWTVIMLFTAILMGEFGAPVLEAISNGKARAHESEIRETLEIMDEYATLASDDANFLGMVGANQRFVDGESVFFYQGDWVAGEYDEMDGFDYQRQWDYVPFPGTDGIYRMGVDAFVATPDLADREALDTFLGDVSSTGSLEALNRIKGSIPPREDVSLDRYPEFLQKQYRDFKSARHFPAGQSLMVPPDGFVDVKSAASDWLMNRDAEQGTRALVEAYER